MQEVPGEVFRAVSWAGQQDSTPGSGDHAGITRIQTGAPGVKVLNNNKSYNIGSAWDDEQNSVTTKKSATEHQPAHLGDHVFPAPVLPLGLGEADDLSQLGKSAGEQVWTRCGVNTDIVSSRQCLSIPDYESSHCRLLAR